MKRTMIAGFAATTLLAGAALATAPQTGANLGTDMESFLAALTAQGYEVIEIELEDGLIEAELRNADGMWEVEVDPASGQILSVEVEDDHDDDEDDDDMDDDA